ncbi:hypothetical protein D3C84_730970 [compost metagenome]
MGGQQLGQPGFRVLCQLDHFSHFRNGDGFQHFPGQQHLCPRRIGLGQAIEAGDFMTQPQQRAVQVKQRRFALGLLQGLRIHRPALLGLAQGFQGKAGKVDLLVGACVEFLSHGGLLRRNTGRCNTAE